MIERIETWDERMHAEHEWWMAAELLASLLVGFIGGVLVAMALGWVRFA